MKIAIIGSAGYIGSYLYTYLSTIYKCTGYDIRDSLYTSIKLRGKDISIEEITDYDIIIYLAGLSGRILCNEQTEEGVYNENVVDICSIANKMNNTQLLIYASSASIVEGNTSILARENTCINNELLDSYAKSMYTRENEISKIDINSVGFRFGTVIGISPVQRTDLVHIAMVKNALNNGVINVLNGSCCRGILALADLKETILNTIKNRELFKNNNIFNLVSFNTTIGEIAESIATLTDASLNFTTNSNLSFGFKLDNTKIKNILNCEFKTTNKTLAEELIDAFTVPKTSCRVCKSDCTNMKVIIDIGKQALANNYVVTPCDQEKFPLILTRCTKCYHTQQDYNVPPEIMFANYQYNSGVSKTLCDYFSWLANDIIDTINKPDGIVLELACNDGSQLDEFSKRGWKTYGIDPASNIVDIALTKGHDVQVVFFGSEPLKYNIPIPDAIVAQNVLAHVPDPILFLKACYEQMGPNTLLYIQTSQCDMYENGEFDTIYHEHMSFFTTASMDYATKSADLQIIRVRKTPIHGTSFLFTICRKDAPIEFVKNYSDNSLELFINNERSLGLYNDTYYINYKKQIYNTRTWLKSIIKQFKQKDYKIVAYGAAAKGMVLMNFFDIYLDIEYIIDDATLKHGKYTAGTNVFIAPPQNLQNDTRKLAIIVLAWNFTEEITKKIINLRMNNDTVLIYPFPNQVIRYILAR